MAIDYLEPELHRLRSEVVGLGRTVENGILQSVDVLQQRAIPGLRLQTTTIEPLITLDHQVNKRRIAIEMDCLALIVTHQPENDDLRAITGMLEIVTELEHIGGYVTDIAGIQLMAARLDEPLLELLNRIHYMAGRVQGMMTQGT